MIAFAEESKEMIRRCQVSTGGEGQADEEKRHLQSVVLPLVVDGPFFGKRSTDRQLVAWIN